MGRHLVSPVVEESCPMNESRFLEPAFVADQPLTQAAPALPGVVCEREWPVVLIFRRRNSAVEEERLNELKQHLVARGRKITESDGVLMTYRRVVEKQFLKVAKERREHLPEASLREISLHYVDAWVAANEERLGIAMPFVINGGLDTYRKEGLKAVLEEIRRDEFTEG